VSDRLPEVAPIPLAPAAPQSDRRPKVVHFEIKPWQEEYLAARLGDLDPRYSPGPLEPASVGEHGDAEIVTVFIRSVVNRAVLAALPSLRLVATRSTGYDHVDLEACRERGIAVCNVPRYGENTVAEHTFGLILALTRHIHQAYLRTARGDFTIGGLEGVDLKGRTLGVAGVGRIGLHVIRIAKGFQMNVLAYDVQENSLLAEVLGFEYTSLDDLLRRSDIVSLHLPLIPTTHHLMNRERFALMKRGAYFVNTARGGIVDTDALLWALDEGIIAGAGLDVVEGEELVVDEAQLLGQVGVEEKLRMVVRQHVLLRRENVVLTPHMAFFSREAEERILDTTVENVRGYLAGDPPNVVLGSPQSRAER
jgi:D-lactate dehydrogenase